MIVLNLSCGNSHRFEGWFGSGDDFQLQSGEGAVVCPVCNDTRIVRLPTGPHVMRSRSAGEDLRQVDVPGKDSLQGSLHALVQALIRNSEDVGNRLPEEARKIHYEEAPARSIHGIATPKEASELLDEGIQILPLPIPPGSEVH